MAHDEPPLTTAVLIHQLPDALAENAIEILEANEVLSRSSVITTKTSGMGMELYLDSEISLERAVLCGAVTIFTTSYRIYPLVTDLTVHGAQAHMRREELKRHMLRLGLVLFVYEEKGTSNYRVIINHPEIPEKVLAWTKSSDVIFKDGLKYPITFFCRFCRTHGHLRCQCDRVRGKMTEKKQKPCLQKSPRLKNPPEHCTPSPSSRSREYNEYCFQPTKTLSRNSKDANLSRTFSQEPILNTKCDSGVPSDTKKLPKNVHSQKYYLLKEEKPDFNKSSVKRNLDSSIDVNGAKRKKVQQIKDQKLKRADPGLPDNTLEYVIAQDFAFSQKKEIEASDEDLNQVKGVKYPGKEDTTHWVPMVDPISGVSRRISDSAKCITLAGSRELKGDKKKNDAKHPSDLRLNHPKDPTSIPKSSSKSSIQPSCHPDFSNNVLKRNSLEEDFITLEELNDIINHAKKNRIIQEMDLKSSNEENTDQLTEQESTKEKIHRENVKLNKSVNFKYGRKQSGKMTKHTCYPKFQGTNSVYNHPYDTYLKNKEKDLHPEEPSMKNPVTQEKPVYDGNCSSKGVGISVTRETAKVRRKSSHPITSETMKKIIENSSGELRWSALKAFFVQVANRRKPLDIARIYSQNVHLIIWQLKSIVLDYYNGQERESKAEVEVRWIKSLIERMETEKKATSQANRPVITVPIKERLQIRVKKEIYD